MDNMKAPCNVSRSLKLSNGKYNVSENENFEVKGGVFKDCKYAWTACKTELRLFRMSVGNKITSWRFDTDISQSDSVTEIGQESRVPHVTCVCELPPRGAVTSSTAPQLLVGLDCGPSRGGAVCICDSSSGSIIATIKVVHPVSSLSVIDGGASPASRLLSPDITNMCGVAAVGLSGCGYVMLVDLRRHDPDGPHTAIVLNEDSFKVPRKFSLNGSDGKVRCYLPAYKVDVTCLQYVPCITSLLVGYNFGCFEIWDLREQKVIYVSPVMEQTIPVAHIAFQEPSDDPRNFCYVWAVHSPSGEVSDSSDSCHPVAFMYALCYQWKEWIDGCGYIYEGFKGCSQHYFFEMKTYENKDTLGGSSITCQAVGTAVSRQHRSIGPDDFDDSVNEGELSLCLFAWESVDADCKSMLRVALFDLDRWYKEEMPLSGNGSYIVVFHLEETLQSWSSPVLDVVVDESSLQPYRSDTGHEEYYRPSALSFVSQVLFEDEMVEINHPGEQQFLLSHLDKSGPLALLHPGQLYKHCLSIGLRPALFDITSPSREIPLEQQRRFLLALALEWQMSGFLHSCAVEWASGSQSVAGCSLPVLLIWGWEFALAVKDEAHKLCAPLFDHSGTKLDRAGRRMLSMYRNQLGHLAKLFSGVLTSPKIPKIYVPDSVEKQAKALETISLYFEVVQWFMNAGLLPEFPDDGVSYGGDLLMEDHHKLLPYPASIIKKFYEDRRTELKKDKVPLFVDLLLEQDKSLKLKELWAQDGGSGCYPPPSLQALLQTYLLEVLETTAKHRFVIYVFLDLADTLDDRYAGAINYLIKFPAAFYMRPSIIKITQAMWLLDHKDFEEALRMLLDPMIRPIDLEQWQHRAIALAFLKQGKANLALDYIVCRNVPLDTFEDIKLKISILIENKKVLEAYECQSMYSVGESNQGLMEFFLCELHRVGLLHQIFYLSLTPVEEKCFFRFLEKYPFDGAGATKMIYYLQNSRIIEAFETADKLERENNENYFNENMRSLPYNYVAKSVELLPEITRKTADVYRAAKTPCNPGIIPEPLSMTLYRQKSSDPRWDRSTGIETILRKIKETWVPELVNDADSLVQQTPFLFYPFNYQLNRHYNSTRAVRVTEKKRGRQDEEEEGTPAKRRRTEDVRPVNNSIINEEPHQSQEVDVSLLLDTPRIKRHSELRTPGNVSSSGTPVREVSTRHSILKVHSISKKSFSPEESVNEDISGATVRAASSDHWTEPNTDYKKTEEKKESEAGVMSASRQIRFALPKESHLDRKKSIMGASPRKPLHEGHAAQTSDTHVEEKRQGDTARPLCFFPKPSSATRDTESKTIYSAKKVGRTLSFSPSPRKQGSSNSEEGATNRGASIKGKFFFPPKPKADDEDSEENQEDSFVSATSDIDSNTEDTSGDKILSPVVSESGSKDLKQSTSASDEIAENCKLVGSMHSVDDHMLQEKCLKTDGRLSFVIQNEMDEPPYVTNISPRITGRESYRRSKATFLTDPIAHKVEDRKLPNSRSNDPMEVADSIQTSDTHSPQTADDITTTEKSTPFMCVSLRKETYTSTVTETKESIVSLSTTTRNTSYSSVRSRLSDEALSAVAGKKHVDDTTITQRATSNLETSYSLSRDTSKGAFNTFNKTRKEDSKSFVSFQPDNTVCTSPVKMYGGTADEGRESPGDVKHTERTVLMPVEDVLSDKSSLMDVRKKREDSTRSTYERTTNSSPKSRLPDVTIHNRSGEIVCNEQVGVDVSSPGILKENQRGVSFNVGGTPELNQSPKTLADIKTGAANNETGNNVSPTTKTPRIHNVTRILPDTSICNSPGNSSWIRHSDNELESLDNSKMSETSLMMEEQMSKNDRSSLLLDVSSTPKTPGTHNVTRILPDTSVWDTPSHSSLFRHSDSEPESLDNTKMIGMSILLPEEEMSEDDKSSPLLDASSPPKTLRVHDVTRILPDTTVWNTPSNSALFRHSDNEPESLDNTKMSEKSILVTEEEMSEDDKSSPVLDASSTPKTPGVRDVTRILPDTSVWNTPNNSSLLRHSDNGAESLDNTKTSEKSDMATVEESFVADNLSMSLVGTGEEIGGNTSSMPQRTCNTPEQNFLLNTTTCISPSPSLDSRQSVDKISPINTQGDSYNVTVTIEDSFEMKEASVLSAERKSASRCLPGNTDNDNPIEIDLHSELQGARKSADSRNISGESPSSSEDKEKKHHALADSDDDDDDEDWRASEEEEDSDGVASEEPVVVDDVAAAAEDSASSSSASIILISSSSSLNSSDSCSSDSDAAAGERKRVCHSNVDFDPLVDPESDTDEEVAAAAVLLKDQGAESENVGLQPLSEECRDAMEVCQTLSPECEVVAAADPGLRDKSTTDTVTAEAKETENADTQSISTGECKISEPVCAVEPSDLSNIAEGINNSRKRTRKLPSVRRLSRCSSEPPTNVEMLQKQRAKKTRSTDSLNKLTGSSAVAETFTDKVSPSKGEARHSPTKMACGDHEKKVVDKSQNIGKRQSTCDVLELPNESVSDDIRKSIQEWMNSPVVTRAGFRRLSSVQSEPPQMDDVSDTASQTRRRRKKSSSVIMQSTSPKKHDSKYTSQHQGSSTIRAARTEAQSAEHEQQMAEYTTERRLTRYQRSLLARSADLAAGRGRTVQSLKLTTSPSPSQSPIRLRSSDRHVTPSPGDADNISVAQSEDSDLSSSLTSSSFLQRSPRSARSEDIIKRPSRRNRNTTVHSPSSVRSMPVAPAVTRSGRLQQVKKRAGKISEELQELSALKPTRRTRSRSSLDESKAKPSLDTSDEEVTKRETQTKAELRVTRSVARHLPSTSLSLLQPIPEESTSGSAETSNKQLTPPKQRKRKHVSRSPVTKKTPPKTKKQESTTRISPRKAMRLRNRLLK